MAGCYIEDKFGFYWTWNPSKKNPEKGQLKKSHSSPVKKFCSLEAAENYVENYDFTDDLIEQHNNNPDWYSFWVDDITNSEELNQKEKKSWIERFTKMKKAEEAILNGKT